MSAALFLAIAVAGGLGAAARMILDTFITARVGSTFPWGTLIINVVGSFALGLILGLAADMTDPPWLSVVGAGLLGGFTTFSTASLETVRLLAGDRPLLGVVQGGSMLVACCLAAGLGLVLGA